MRIALVLVATVAYAEPPYHARLEGAFGLRFGRYRVDGQVPNDLGESTESGHFDLGIRADRWFVYGEWELVARPYHDRSLGARSDAARGDFEQLGMIQHWGGNVRYAFARTTCADCAFELYAEAGTGVEVIGGYKWRRDVSLGVGGTTWGGDAHRHGAASLGLRLTSAQRYDGNGRDIAAMVDLTFAYGL